MRSLLMEKQALSPVKCSPVVAAIVSPQDSVECSPIVAAVVSTSDSELRYMKELLYFLYDLSCIFHDY